MEEESVRGAAAMSGRQLRFLGAEYFRSGKWTLLARKTRPSPERVIRQPRRDGKLPGLPRLRGAELLRLDGMHRLLQGCRRYGRQQGWEGTPDALTTCPVANSFY